MAFYDVFFGALGATAGERPGYTLHQGDYARAVGLPLPGDEAETDAVNIKDWLMIEGFRDDMSAVMVLS